MSFFDEDIKKSVWEGKIPIIFTLSPDDLTSHLPPSPYTFMAPRNSYFPLITSVVKEYFSSSTLVLLDEMWLEYRGIPLKWHVPIGVLYDTLVLSKSGGVIEQPYWNIVVHFQSYPDKILLKCPNIEAVRTYYKNVLKEATFIKQGDINKFNNLTINQSNDLWDGLKNHDYDKFWSVNKKFAPNSYKEYKNIPIRLIINYKPPVQELIPVYDGENSTTEITLENLFSKIPYDSVSSLFNYISNSNNTGNLSPPLSPSDRNSAEVDNNIENSINQSSLPPSAEYSNLLQFMKACGIKYRIQGIEPPLDSSAVWLYEYFSHPDNFIYITLFDPSNLDNNSFNYNLNNSNKNSNNNNNNE
ncbi:hypothetical protein DICPUDRAFT_80751 [Dictyostelium purpureum]|uniref:Autophagy protein 5 n=1 Tax=Dictyostelium purpureum TaxID=5786 RepID=F0ZRF1_DICPU|nr:uncharacterized protein DICPUDRAFT_80751 [Dictyostelium purpureum]EGC33469.1 hypothetical protein DICPUDRAFT_80751 [Dictyostelium purpureum]|eukprot:XP_003289992.1 hypothetical protein DICPUDRAFT_80751 [Dictyostelium purpureum]